MSRWLSDFGRCARLACAAAFLAFAGSAPANAQDSDLFPGTGPDVDVALVLAVDISFSMDIDELNLQRTGYIEALTSPLVLDAIRKGMVGKVAVTYIEWAGVNTRHVIADWSIIEDQASAEAFVQKLREAPVRRARRTSVTTAIEFSIDRLKQAQVRPIRRVIDISGDGPNNEGGLVTRARDAAVEAGVVINGLPIIIKRGWSSPYDVDNLDDYYRDCVIGGPGSFMLTITEKDQFAPAIKQKILRELASPSQNDVTATPARGETDCTMGERQWRQQWERN
ncbi:MAG: DUF1194 domain-containing protein [Methylobacterium sp.]|uniref:DUF1194 domain-containing protein n=1 Tax=Rhabdaerophilum sp. TaxID=2717341 RepID=UPI0022BCF726|nr:DUF1194 domain-containing protein [Methylobacterium sp.]MCZ8269763.1 DUF1194 domain-containing protein [Beijerinckiaceae bacterium]MCA3639895.1 DUF1194 domain-containing protein [Methylobacterium sp.]MCA3654407.1 DUF1194 domain-containing protein [Methylobacterium sp.]MCA3657824.1 DUF1194 domain-containing protein [Methylobacterium sp.]